MKLKTKQTFKTLKGKTIEAQDGGEKVDLNLGMVLSEIILTPHKNKNGFRPLKSYELAKKFYEEDTTELSDADYIQIKELVEESESYGTIIIAQALLMLEEAKEKARKEEK